MKVICINDGNYNGSKFPNGLTNGKVYEVLSNGNWDWYETGNDWKYYSILNDFGEILSYNQSMFISLKEYRRIKLENLECVSNGEVI